MRFNLFLVVDFVRRAENYSTGRSHNSPRLVLFDQVVLEPLVPHIDRVDLTLESLLKPKLHQAHLMKVLESLHVLAYKLLELILFNFIKVANREARLILGGSVIAVAVESENVLVVSKKGARLIGAEVLVISVENHDPSFLNHVKILELFVGLYYHFVI